MIRYQRDRLTADQLVRAEACGAYVGERYVVLDDACAKVVFARPATQVTPKPTPTKATEATEATAPAPVKGCGCQRVKRG